MKKLILPILLFMMFIPFYVNAETCDTDKISISSITVEDKSDNVEELDEASSSGKNINLNLSMSKVGDNIEYKIVVKNDSNEDYEFDKNSFNISSDYIDYTIESDDNSNIVKANSGKTVYLKVEYKTEVPDETFESGTYNDNKTMTVNLSTNSLVDNIINPNTGVQSYIIIMVLTLIISVTLYVILRKKEYAKFMVLLIGTAIIIPVSVYAICKCDIMIESNIKIVRYRDSLLYDYIVNDNQITITRYNDDLANTEINFNINNFTNCKNYFKEEFLYMIYNEDDAEKYSLSICNGGYDGEGKSLKNYIYDNQNENYYNAIGINNVTIASRENRITDIVIPNNIIGYPVTVIRDGVFADLGLTSVVLPEYLKVIESGFDSTLEGAFGANNITSIEFPDSLEYIGDFAFSHNKLEEIIIPNNVKFIGSQAFRDNNISRLKLGTSLEYIGIEAFINNKLTSVTIPSSVMKMFPVTNTGVWYKGSFYGNPIQSVIIEGKSSANEFTRYGNTINDRYYTPFSWDENITCVKDNDENVENGCITWMGSN